jgi:hypothetical protein
MWYACDARKKKQKEMYVVFLIPNLEVTFLIMNLGGGPLEYGGSYVICSTL